MDVCPYILAAGYPLKVYGLNMVGLKRRGFSEHTIRLLEKAYKIIFRSKLNTKEALARVQSELEPIPEIQNLVSFIQKSERGIIK
jgi:UDP-N-acetylglucosamine acyltransferase